MGVLTLTRGDTGIFTTSISNLSASGLTGYSAWFTAKRDPSDADTGAVFQKTITSGGIQITTAGNATTPGFLTTTVVPADTDTLPAGYAVLLVYDVKVKDGSGVETTVDSGTILVSADVTNAV